MAYGIKYLFKFESAAGTTREIRVLKDGYSGDPIQRSLGRAPVLKKNDGGTVRGTSLEFYAECSVDGEFTEFYTSDPKEYRVDLYAGSTLLWQGYITPELYSEPDIAPPYDVQVIATDGIGELKLYDFAAQGTATLRALLTYLLGYTGLGTDVYLVSSLNPGSAGAGALLSMSINLDYMAGSTCYEVLTYLLDTLHATITWWKGKWMLVRETNVTVSGGKVQYYNTSGTSALLADSIQTLGRMRVAPAWPVGQLSTVIDPAKNKVTIQAPWHVITALANSEMSSDTSWTKYNSAIFNNIPENCYLLPYPSSGTPQLRQQLSMTGLRVPMSLSVKASAATSTISNQAVSGTLGVLLVYKVGNTSYHLRKGGDGVPVWLEGSTLSGAIPAGTPVDYVQTLTIWDATRIEAEELVIENIPPFMQSGSFPSGTLSVYIIGYCCRVFSAHLDVTLPKGYQDVILLDNGARGEGDSVEIAIGREVSDVNYYKAFLQGLLLNSGSLITSFADANFTSGLDFLAFIARDYALSVALPRAKVTGTVYLEASIQHPPLIFTKGGLDYWLETFSWNLYDDELEIEAKTLPGASLTVDSEVLLESDGSTVGAGSSAGSSSASPVGAGGGVNYFEVNSDLPTMVQPKSGYDYLSAKGGLFFNGWDPSNPSPDLEVRLDANDNRFLYSPLPLITGGDQILVNGTPGSGGGGGGGASNLYDLQDVYHSGANVLTAAGTNRGDGDLLGFNSTLGKWVAVTSATLLDSLSVATSGAKGLMSAADKAKLDAIAAGATAVTESTVTGWGFTKNLGTVTSVTLNSGTGITVSNSGSAITESGSRTISLNVASAKTALGLGTMAYETATNYVPAIRTINGKALSSNVVLSLDDVADGSTRRLANYVLKAGDTMTGTLKRTFTATDQPEGIRFIGGDYDNYLLTIASSSTTANVITYGYGLKYIGTGTGAANALRLMAGNQNGTPVIALAFNQNGQVGIKTAADTSFALKVNGAAYADSIKIGSATISWNSNGYLYIDKPLTTAGDQILISGTPGGGGGGGGAILSSDLLDAGFLAMRNSNNANDGKMLVWSKTATGVDGLTGAWVTIDRSSVGVTTVATTSAAGLMSAADKAKLDAIAEGATYVTESTVAGWGFTKNAGTVTSIKVGTTSYNPSSGVVSLPAYPSDYWKTGDSRAANYVLAAPNGSNGAATFRALVAADIPALAISKITNLQTTLDGKQAVISDLSTIRSNATNGNTAFGWGNHADFGYLTSVTLASGTNNGTLKLTVNGTVTDNIAVKGLGTMAYETAANYVLKAGDTMSGNLAVCITPNSNYPVSRTWANFIVEDDTAVEGGIRGGNIILSRGYSATANRSAGAITFHGRRLTSGYRNGARIAGVAGSDASSYDRIDLVFYSSNETTSSASPVYTEAMRVKANATVVIGTLTATTVNGYTLAAACAKGVDTSITASSTSANLPTSAAVASLVSNYLPLAGGTMTGDIKMTNGEFINAASGYAMLGLGSAGTTFYCGPGYEVSSSFFIRSGNINLTHRKHTASSTYTDYVVWDASNSNLSTVNWAANNLTAAGSLTVAGASTFSSGATFANRVYLNWLKADGVSAVNVFGVNNSNQLLVGYGMREAYTTIVYGNPVRLNANGTNVLSADSTGVSVTGGLSVSGAGAFDTLTITSTSAAAHINFSRAGYNYINVPANGYLSFTVDGSGTAKAAMTINPSKYVGIGTASPAYPLHVAGNARFNVPDAQGFSILRTSSGGNAGVTYYAGNQTTKYWISGHRASNDTFFWNYGGSYVASLTSTGTLTTIGDQVLSSDATLKTNWRGLNYGVEDIAKATAGVFDWKDGRGSSAGTIAQDWKKLVPELVHGEEGNMTLAYGQLALVNTILEAREIERLKAKITELENEVKRLRS